LRAVKAIGTGTMPRGARMEAQALPPLKAQGSSAAAGLGSEGRDTTHRLHLGRPVIFDAIQFFLPH